MSFCIFYDDVEIGVILGYGGLLEYLDWTEAAGFLAVGRLHHHDYCIKPYLVSQEKKECFSLSHLLVLEAR